MRILKMFITVVVALIGIPFMTAGSIFECLAQAFTSGRTYGVRFMKWIDK